MKYMLILVSFSSSVMADAFQDGKAFTEKSSNANVESFASTGISASESPGEAELNDNAKINAAIDVRKASDEVFLAIKSFNENPDPKRTEIIDIPDITDREGAVDAEQITNTPAVDMQYVGPGIKTCRKSGELMTITCKQQRMVEIKVTPEVKSRYPRDCPGHWNWSGTGKNYCGGCRGGDEYIAQEKKVDITRDEWVGCEELERMSDVGEAEIASVTKGTYNETRMIDKEPITNDYWEITRTYTVNTKTFDECVFFPAQGCLFKESECEEYITGIAGVKTCKIYKMTYDCSVYGHIRRSKPSTLGLTLPPPPLAVDNRNMYNALGQIEAMRQMAKHMEGGEASLRIFRGEPKACSTNFGGSFKDCCKRAGGIGTNMHMATECTADEKNLVQAKEQKRCVFVGARQKNKPLGMNVSKEYVYCCYPSRLGRAIQEGSREQLRKDFGTAEHPSCDGLTPDELSRVDFSTIDLSETFSTIASAASFMNRDVQIDLAQKQRQFKQSAELSSIKANQPHHKRVKETGETHDIVY